MASIEFPSSRNLNSVKCVAHLFVGIVIKHVSHRFMLKIQLVHIIRTYFEICFNDNLIGQGLALQTLSWDKNWDSHSLVNGYPSFYPRIALVAPSPGEHIKFGIIQHKQKTDRHASGSRFPLYRGLFNEDKYNCKTFPMRVQTDDKKNYQNIFNADIKFLLWYIGYQIEFKLICCEWGRVRDCLILIIIDLIG